MMNDDGADDDGNLPLLGERWFFTLLQSYKLQILLLANSVQILLSYTQIIYIILLQNSSYLLQIIKRQNTLETSIIEISNQW